MKLDRVQQAETSTNRIHKLTMPEATAKERLANQYPHISIVEWGGKSTAQSIFADSVYGIFTAKFSNVITGNKIHPDRTRAEYKLRKNHKRMTIEEAKKRLEALPAKIELLIWGGSASAKSTFTVNDEKKITTLLRLCKEKFFTSEDRKALSKAKWEDAQYREKTLAGLRGSDWQKTQAKRKVSMLAKYQVEHALQNSASLEKAQQATKARFGATSYAQSVEGRARLKQISIETGRTKIYNGKSMQDIAKQLGKAYTTVQAQIKRYGYEHFDKVRTRGTLNMVESLLLSKFIQQGWDTEQQKKIGKYFADFVINKVIIEVDGLFWHSDHILKDKTHGVRRKQFLESQGYKVLIFREDEVRKKTEVVLSVISHNIGKTSNQAYARKTTMAELGTKEAGKLFDNWHLMGSGAGKCLTLVYKGEVVSAIRYKKKGNGLEISRFVCRPNWSVIGGFSKLIKEIQTREPGKNILTFIDQRYGAGTYLKSLGFNKLPTHQSFKWTNGSKCWHRLAFPGSSGYDKGLAKLWDYGQTPWMLNSA